MSLHHACLRLLRIHADYNSRLQLTTIGNRDSLRGGTIRRTDFLDSLDNVQAFRNSAEDDVLAIQPPD